MSALFSLFIEVGCLKNKLNQIKYELGCVVMPKNSKKDRFYLNQKVPGPDLEFVPISTWKVPTDPLGC